MRPITALSPATMNRSPRSRAECDFQRFLRPSSQRVTRALLTLAPSPAVGN